MLTSQILLMSIMGSTLGPLLFLIYINDFHLAIKYSEVHHFEDDTNSINNHDLKNLENWVKANMISFNVGKTKLALFTFT